MERTTREQLAREPNRKRPEHRDPTRASVVENATSAHRLYYAAVLTMAARAQGFPTVPTDITREAVIAKCEFYARVALWPPSISGVDPRGWLSNFTEDEMRHAVYLLNSFIYFNASIIDRIFIATCQQMSRVIANGSARPADLVVDWNAFLHSLVVTPVRGERPAPTDSGSLFTRRARHRLKISKSQILDQRDALAHVRRTSGDVLFVDDFVGTGNQFADTFNRQCNVDGENISLAELASEGIGRYFYCPVVATARGARRIALEFPQVELIPGHVLPDRYGVLHPDSLIWPADLKPTARDFVYSASMRAGIPDAPKSEPHWEGFDGHSLALAFDHGAPDATLPILWWEENGWKPLKGRG